MTLLYILSGFGESFIQTIMNYSQEDVIYIMINGLGLNINAGSSPNIFLRDPVKALQGAALMKESQLSQVKSQVVAQIGFQLMNSIKPINDKIVTQMFGNLMRLVSTCVARKQFSLAYFLLNLQLEYKLNPTLKFEDFGGS